MLTRPAGVSDDALRRWVSDQWGLAVTDVRYLPVGFGSHHWDAAGPAGARWFVTVDEVGGDAEPLRSALETAVDLRAAGCDFVVAPIPASDGAACAQLGAFAVALYPHVDGETYAFGKFANDEHRRGVLDLIVALHTVPLATAVHAARDRFVIPNRAALERELEVHAARTSTGPYAAPTLELIGRNRDAIRAALAAYDRFGVLVDDPSHPVVVTHGEPHAANTIRTAGGWVLIDWDTTLVAPPERDLWALAEDDDAVLDAYRDATGTAVSDAGLALYAIRWDLTEIAVYADRFRRPHDGDADDDKSWVGLVETVDHLVR